MRTYLLQLLTAVAAISLLFASVAYAQNEPPRGPSLYDEQGQRLEPPPVVELPLCHDDEKLDVVGLGANGWTKEMCEAEGYTWLPVGTWISNEVSPETAQTQPEPTVAEPAPVEQPPTSDLPTTQPAKAQQGSPQYTG